MSGQHQHHNEGLSNSVSSTPSSSVQPLELPAQEMMANQMQHDSSIHVQGTSMVAPGDVSMDGSEDHNPPPISKADHNNNNSNSGSAANKETPSKSEGGKSKDKRERLSRACVACHTGKTRCSNTLPCESCIKRGISNSCAYPDPLETNSEAAVNHPIAPRRRAAHGHANGSPAAAAQAAPHQNPGVPHQSISGPGGQVNTQGVPIAQSSSQTVFSAGPTVRGFYYDSGTGTGQGTFAAPSAPSGSGPSPNGSIMSPAGAGSLNLGIRREQTPPPGNSRPTKKARYRNLTETELATFHPKPYKRGTFYVGESAPVTIDPRLPLRLLLADEERVDFFVGDILPP